MAEGLSKMKKYKARIAEKILQWQKSVRGDF